MLKLDGIIGKITIKAINACYPEMLFNTIKSSRIHYYHVIAKRGENHKFLNDWLKRIDSIILSLHKRDSIKKEAVSNEIASLVLLTICKFASIYVLIIVYKYPIISNNCYPK